uniref:Enoyl reductase (ER) domain-containing protein n=1 Tax=Alexandrium monilatum TaxID=311494 RepID=A0A7S4WDF3_9DINO
MVRVVVEALGKDIPEGIGKLKVKDDPPGKPPAPRRDSVVVEVHAASVNFPDLLMTCGGYQYKPKLPYTPGTEACGIVSAVGEGVTDLAPGDSVMVGLREGCMCSQLLVPAAACTPLPQGLSFSQGASFLVAYTTAYHCLVERAQTQPKDVVLINGATGGVGLAAVQIAKAVGCQTIIATGSTADKLNAVQQCGATHCIDLADPSTPASKLGELLKEATGGRGVDVIYDPVGGEVFDASLRGTAWAARVLIVGFAGGVRPVIRANYALIKGLTIMGCRAGESVRMDPSLQAPRMAQLERWTKEGKLQPHVSHTFDASHVREAFLAVMERKVTGKAVVTFGHGGPPVDARSRL